jgi:hypothetical protein
MVVIRARQLRVIHRWIAEQAPERDVRMLNGVSEIV